MSADNLNAQFTLYTGSAVLSKGFRLVDGQLVKTTGGQMTSGTARTITVQTLGELAAIIKDMTMFQAAGYGIFNIESCQVVTAEKFARLKDKSADLSGVRTRTKDMVDFPVGNGLFEVDYDPPNDGISMAPEELHKALKEIEAPFPFAGLLDGPSLTLASASSYICNSDSGEQLKGQGGLRVLIAVTDPENGPEVARRLHARLILNNHGYAQVRDNGSIAIKSLIDYGAVAAERLDFLAGAACESPLCQKRPEFLILNEGAQPISLEDAVPALTIEEERRLAEITKALENDPEVQAEAKLKREAWLQQMADRWQANHPDQELPEGFADRLDKSTNPGAPLSRNHTLQLQSGEEITVGELLAEGKRYNGAKMHDPMEPDYAGGDNRIAQFYFNEGSTPMINSNAHGGTVYRLADASCVFGEFDEGDTTLSDLKWGAAEFTPVSGLKRSNGVRWIIEGYVPENTLGVSFGPPEAGKTFFCIDRWMCVATGTPWEGHAVKQGIVMYCCGEAHDGIQRRTEAWSKHKNHPFGEESYFMVSDHTIHMDGMGVETIIKNAKAAMANRGVPVAGFLIDTLARHIDGNENETQDMSRFVASLDKLRRAFPGCAVEVVHHPGLTPGRLRGSVALKGAVDYEIQVNAGTISYGKMKDAAKPPPTRYKLETVSLSFDDKGKEITSCVVVYDFQADTKPDAAAGQSKTGKPRNDSQELGYNTLLTAIDKVKNRHGETGEFVAHLDDWRDVFYAASTAENQVAKRQAFNRARKELRTRGDITVDNDLYRPTREFTPFHPEDAEGGQNSTTRTAEA